MAFYQFSSAKDMAIGYYEQFVHKYVQFLANCLVLHSTVFIVFFFEKKKKLAPHDM